MVTNVILESVQSRDRIPLRAGCQVRVPERGPELRVPEDLLHLLDAPTGHEELGGAAVAEDPPGDRAEPCPPLGPNQDPVGLVPGERSAGAIAEHVWAAQMPMVLQSLE